MYVSIFGCAGSLLLLGLFSSCGKKGLLFLAVRRFLVEVTSLVKHGLRTTGSAVVVQRLSCSVAMWDLLGPGIELVSPALAVDSLSLSHYREAPWLNIFIYLKFFGRWLAYSLSEIEFTCQEGWTSNAKSRALREALQKCPAAGLSCYNVHKNPWGPCEKEILIQ